MPILIIEQRGIHKAGTLSGRVLIGRWPHNTIVIDDRTVSRIHAWIGVRNGRYYIADAFSRTGTFVNGEPLRDSRDLNDADHILIGSAVLRYRQDPELPEAFEVVDLSPRSAEELSDDKGIFKDCACGAPLWLPREYTGTGRCRYCGQRVRPNATDAGQVAPAPRQRKPAAKTPAPAVIAPDSAAVVLKNPRRMEPPSASAGAAVPVRTVCCGVCHSEITASDETTRCPSCELVFHVDCWNENRGCSAFGCQQVGILDHNEPKDPALA